MHIYSNVYWTVHHCNSWIMKDQLDVTCYFISLLMCSTCCASACKTSTTQNQPHQISNTQRTENKTTDVVIQQHSRKFLMMDILMSETCWAHKKWNKIASDIKFIFHSSTITMMHGPINIRVAMAICLWALLILRMNSHFFTSNFCERFAVFPVGQGFKKYNG